MSLKQKLLGSVIFILAIVAGVFFVSNHLAHKAQAQAACTFAACSKADVTGSNGTYIFTDQAHITAIFGSRTVVFTDVNSPDGTHNYVAPDGTFCSGGHGKGDITISGSDWSKVVQGQSSIPATVDVDYPNTSAVGSPCINWGNMKTTVTNASGVASKSYEWQGDTIAAVDGSETLSPVKLTGKTERLYAKDASDKCSGGLAILLDVEHGNAGYAYGLAPYSVGNPLKDVSADPQMQAYGNPYPPKTCTVVGKNRVTIAGAWNTGAAGVCPDGSTPDATTGLCADGSTPTGTTGTAAPTCESSSSTALEWIMCPIFNIISDMVNHLVGLFMGQLCFRTDISSTGTTATCNGGAFDTSGIKPVWSAIKNITSAALVIVMLIAIISQAFSIGPIDAYTIRKLLPKLVAAVILIQISFYLFSWVINVVDDIGEGLNSLLHGLFPSNINDLGNLLANASGGIQHGTAVFWLSVVAAIGFAVAALPTVILMLFVALVAILVGLAVLVLRKVLIIALLILAPVALLMWVLPNTERYWKMWFDNFLKVLFMFPIIVLIIEAGRIFAWVAGKATGGGFIGVFLVFVGFFGPLFLLPKTYRWGGSLMQASGDSIFRASGKMTEKPQGYFKARQEGLSAERKRQSEERYQKGIGVGLNKNWKRGFGVPSLYRRPMDLARSGQIDPLLWGRRKQQATTAYEAAGAESYEADLKAAQQRQSLMYEEAFDHDKLARDLAAGYDSDDFDKPAKDRRAITYKTKSGEVRTVGKVSMVERQAALGAAATYGGGTNWRFVDRMNDELNKGNDEEKVMAERFRNANSQTLLPKMKHVYYGTDRDGAINTLVENGISESAFAGMDAAEMEAILASLSKRVAKGGDDGEKAAGLLSSVLTSYDSAISNSNIRPNVDAALNKAVEAFVDGANIDSINYKEEEKTDPATGEKVIKKSGRRTVGLPEINRSAADNPLLEQQIAKLKGRIDQAGNIRQAEPPATPRADSGSAGPRLSSDTNNSTHTPIGLSGEIDLGPK